MSEVGNNIRKAREALGWTQEELAKRMGYKSKTTVNKVEKGVNDIPQSKIVKYARTLGVTPSVLMGWVTVETDQKASRIAKVTNLLREDDVLLEMVETLATLSEEKRAVIRPLLATLAQE